MLDRAEDICVIANAADCTGCTLAWRHGCATTAELLIESLSVYMREHFKYEEQQMDWSVPHDHVNDHRRAHNEIAARVQEVVDRCRKADNPASAARDLVSLLSQWLCDHAERHDVVLATFIGDSEDADEFLID
jgi:hemerythrin-like metal-binding protein